MPASKTTESYTPAEIHAGDYPIATENGIAGAAVAENDIVGRITASGKIVVSTKAASDGSETPIGIAAYAAAALDDKLTWYTSGGYDSTLIGLGDRTVAEAQVAFDRTPIEVVIVSL